MILADTAAFQRGGSEDNRLDLAENRIVFNVVVVISYEINHLMGLFSELFRVYGLKLSIR